MLQGLFYQGAAQLNRWGMEGKSMSEISQWINTILLIIILCYQWNKNKAFSHRIDQQTKLLNDTKIVVTQQATAVDSQAKVVETAIKYTESFDPEKIESILRKQIETESAEKLSELEKQYQKELSNKDQKYKEKLKEYITYSINEAITSSKTYIEQLLKMVIVLRRKSEF